jgi:ABC-type uncharacterized transport system permease subunit
MLASIFSLNVLQTALELGCIYALVALALFLSYSILNIADLSTDGCFTLGCAVACQAALTGHPILALFAAMAAGVCSGFVTAFLQTRLGVESIMAGIICGAGYVLWALLMKNNPVSRIAIFGFVNPVVNVLLSAVLNGEPLFRWQYLAALVFVCVGIWLVNKAPAKKEGK